MSITQIEAELKRLSAEELRRLAVSSWAAYVEKEGLEPTLHECDETSPELLAALDTALRQAEGAGAQVHSADEVRARIRDWTTR